MFGAAYVGIGLVGFALTGFDRSAASEGAKLLVFEVNPLHNTLHLLIGVGLVTAAAAGEHAARRVTIATGAVYGVLAVVGSVIGGDPRLDVLALNGADHLLHLVTAVTASVAVTGSLKAETVG